MNLLIHGGFKFTILDTTTIEPIHFAEGLVIIHNRLRDGTLTIDFPNGTILDNGKIVFFFTIEPNKGTEFRFQH